MSELKSLFNEQMSKKFKWEFNESDINDQFYLNYSQKAQFFEELVGVTSEVIEIPRSNEFLTSNLNMYLTALEVPDYESRKIMLEQSAFYFDIFSKENVLVYDGSTMRFKQNARVSNKYFDSFVMRADQKISAFYNKVINKLPLDEETKKVYINNLDHIVTCTINDLRPLYLRVGVEPVDYLEMGQWGNNSSCTDFYIQSMESGFSKSDYTKAVFTYMQMPVFVASLFDSKEDAEERKRTAVARQLFYYGDKNNILGLRGYGDSEILKRSIREGVALYLREKTDKLFVDRPLQNLKNRKQLPHISDMYLDYKDEVGRQTIYPHSLGYIDTIHYPYFAGHTLLKSANQMNIFDIIEPSESIRATNDLSLNELRELSSITKDVFGGFCDNLHRMLEQDIFMYPYGNYTLVDHSFSSLVFVDFELDRENEDEEEYE